MYFQNRMSTISVTPSLHWQGNPVGNAGRTKVSMLISLGSNLPATVVSGEGPNDSTMESVSQWLKQKIASDYFESIVDGETVNAGHATIFPGLAKAAISAACSFYK